MTLDAAYEEFQNIKLNFALDADPRMPLGCIIIHQENLIAGADHLSGTIFVWPLMTIGIANTLKSNRILKGHQAHVTALLDLDDRFASCSKDGTVRIWKDLNCVFIFQKSHGLEKYPTSLAAYYRPDSKIPIIFSGGTDGLIVAYDLVKKRASNITGGHSGWILCLACKKDGPFLFSGSTDYTIRLWDSMTLQYLYSFQGHSDSIYSLCSFENIIVSGDRSGKIRIFDVFTGECLNVFEQDSVVNSLQVYRRNKRIRVLSMGQGNFLNEWDICSLELNRVNKYHFGTIRSSLIFQGWLITAARDGAVGIWKLTKDDMNESSNSWKIVTNENSYNFIPETWFSMKNEWKIIQKAFQEQAQANLDLQDEIRYLKADILNMDSQPVQSLDEDTLESNQIFTCIKDILDLQLKNASHQLVKSAILLDEIKPFLNSDADYKDNITTILHDESTFQNEIMPSSDNNSLGKSLAQDSVKYQGSTEVLLNELSYSSSIPLVLSASTCSETDRSDFSDSYDDLTLYYGSKSYQEENNFLNSDDDQSSPLDISYMTKTNETDVVLIDSNEKYKISSEDILFSNWSKIDNCSAATNRGELCLDF